MPDPRRLPERSRFRQAVALVRLSRLVFLLGGLAGWGFGTAMAAFARGSVDWGDAAGAAASILAFQLMTHYANDYFDVDGDALARRTPFSGGSGVLVDGSLPRKTALNLARLAAAAGGATAAGLLMSGRPLGAVLALAIGALAWAYSAPPLRLLARGLGELDTALVVAILVPLCAYAAQGLVPDARALLSTVPYAAATFAMMLAVHVPDVAADRASGKANLLVRYGPGGSRALLLLALAVVYLSLPVAVWRGAPAAFGWCAALTLPVAAVLAFSFRWQRESHDPAAARRVATAGSVFAFAVVAAGVLAYASLSGVRTL